MRPSIFNVIPARFTTVCEHRIRSASQCKKLPRANIVDVLRRHRFERSPFVTNCKSPQHQFFSARRVLASTTTTFLPMATPSSPKRARTGPAPVAMSTAVPSEGPLGIVTHSGDFHADEALAVSLLRRLPRFSELPLTRTRDPALIDRGTIVVDVGATYEPEKQRFDHHQRGFDQTFDAEHTIKLSSAGLTWKHFGQEILAHNFPQLESSVVDELWIKLYDDFVQAIDGLDNGISAFDGEPRYHSRTDLSSRVGTLNPSWNETEQKNDASRMERFEQASAMAGAEFWNRVLWTIKSWLPARELVDDALAKRTERVSGADGRILLLTEYTNWKSHIFGREKKLGLTEDNNILYVVFPDESGGWRIQAVPVTDSSFISRKALPEPWRGVRDDSLSEVTGIPGGVFVHASGFIGGNKTQEGALAMARKALAWE